MHLLMAERERWLLEGWGSTLYKRGTVMCDPVVEYRAVKPKDAEIHVTTHTHTQKKIIIASSRKAPIIYSARNLFNKPHIDPLPTADAAGRACARTRARSLQITRSDA